MQATSPNRSLPRVLLTLLLILALSPLTLLTSCGGDADLPEGMQCARGGEDVGYYFYVPEEWTVANQGSISGAYVSRVNRTSVTYTECPMPEQTLDEYFAASLAEFPTEPVVTVSGEPTTFGNAEVARKYVYRYKYQDVSYGFFQIFACFEGRFGVFTYSAERTVAEGSETSRYDTYLEKAQSVAEHFRYVAKSGSHTPQLPEADADGYRLVSDKRVCGFSLYLPDELTVADASGAVNASFADGASLSLSRATETGVDIGTYWERRREELSAITTDFILIESNVQATLANCNHAASFEYTYRYNGKTYHVYQVMGTTTFSGYVFTYTAEEAGFASHWETVSAILSRVTFS